MLTPFQGSACRLLLAGLVIAAVVAPQRATAQKLSDRPITIIVPYTPGTGIDILARTVGQEISTRWGQPVIVEN